MAGIKKTDMEKERLDYISRMWRTEDESDIIKGLIKLFHMKGTAAENYLKRFKRSKGVKSESKFEAFLISLNENKV